MLLSPPSEREIFLVWMIKDLGALWFISIFLMSIMIGKLRDISIEKFLDPNIPYPPAIKNNMEKDLYAVFSPYKLKNEKEPKWFKRHPHLFNHLYPALFISILAGAIGFVLSYLETPFRPVNAIIGSTGVAVSWFLTVIMGYMMIGIAGILRKLSKELKNSDDSQSFASILKIMELKVLPLNILYSFTSIMISFPTVLRFLMVGKGPWVYGNWFLLIMELLSLFFVMIFPFYYVHLTIKSVKEQFCKREFSLIEDLENKIHNKSATDIDLKTYELSINMLNRAEKINTWPFDFASITKIVIAGAIGSIPTILQIFFIK